MKFLVIIILSLIINHDSVPIKIIDGIDKYSDRSENQLTYIIPNIFSGPETLSFLKGSCIVQAYDRYEYTICPFYNITEKRISTSKSSVLGIWKEWDDVELAINTNTINSDTTVSTTNDYTNSTSIKYYHKQIYLDGKVCNNDKDTSKVLLYLDCEYPNKITVLSVEDTSMCDYKIHLGLPISCSLLYT